MFSQHHAASQQLPFTNIWVSDVVQLCYIAVGGGEVWCRERKCLLKIPAGLALLLSWLIVCESDWPGLPKTGLWLITPKWRSFKKWSSGPIWPKTPLRSSQGSQCSVKLPPPPHNCLQDKQYQFLGYVVVKDVIIMLHTKGLGFGPSSTV